MNLAATNPEANGPMTWRLLGSAVLFVGVITPAALVVLGVISGAFIRRLRRRATPAPVRVHQSNVRLLVRRDDDMGGAA